MDESSCVPDGQPDADLPSSSSNAISPEENNWLHDLLAFVEAERQHQAADPRFDSVRQRLASDPEARRIYIRLSAMEANEWAETHWRTLTMDAQFDLSFLKPTSLPPNKVNQGGKSHGPAKTQLNRD